MQYNLMFIHHNNSTGVFYFHSMAKRHKRQDFPKVVTALGERLKQLRKDKKLLQRNLAHDAGMDVENYRKYEAGKQEMRVSTLVRLAEALGVEVGELFKK